MITAASLTDYDYGAGAMHGHGAAVCAGSPSYLITAASQATPASVLIAVPALGPSLPEVEPGSVRGGVKRRNNRRSRAPISSVTAFPCTT